MQFEREFVTLPIEAIRPWQNNPSIRTLPGRALEELVESIRRYGVVDPLTVVPAEIPGIYDLVRGHRRLTAAKEIGYRTIRCEVWHLPFDLAMEIAASCERAQRPWAGRVLGEVFVRHGKELGLRLVGRRHERVIRQAFDVADDPSLVFEILATWGPRALVVLLRAAERTGEPFDRWARAALANGSYRDAEDRVKGMPAAQRTAVLRELLAEWEQHAV